MRERGRASGWAGVKTDAGLSASSASVVPTRTEPGGTVTVETATHPTIRIRRLAAGAVVVALLSAFSAAVARPAEAAAVVSCPWQYEHPTTVNTPAAVRSKAINYTRRVEKLGVKALSRRADVLKAPWWTVGEHRCKWRGQVSITYGGQLPEGVAVGYRILVTTSGQMLSGGDALWLTLANVRNTWKVVSAGTSP